MHRFLNQHSFVLAALVVLAVVGAVLWRVKRRWIKGAVLGGLVAAFLVAFLLLRTGGGDVKSVADLDRALARGRPVMLQFYSDL